MKRESRCVVLVLMNPVSARADATVLVGLKSVDAVRPSFGFSFGYRPTTVGFEIEYLSTFGQTAPGDYSAGGIFASVIVQPVTISHVQIFAVGGFGAWQRASRAANVLGCSTRGTSAVVSWSAWRGL